MTRRENRVSLRAYQPSDCRQLAELFYQTVHSVNAGDYTREQLDAWADGKADLAAWNRSFLEHRTLVAWENGRIVGFGDMDSHGYLDRLFVHFQHQGRASARRSVMRWSRRRGGCLSRPMPPAPRCPSSSTGDTG